MDEEQRRNYLNTMGITVWLSRLNNIPVPECTATVESTSIGQDNPVLADITVPLSTQATTPSELGSVVSKLAFQPMESTNYTLLSPPILIKEQPQQVDDSSSQPAIPIEVSALDWETLALRVEQCQACEELVANRSRTVFGVGNRQARLLLIGEAPGEEEDRQGEPFVGKAGQLLNSMLNAIGLKRTDVYIANILKCRPPANRNPNKLEAQCCEPWLVQQIELVSPELILAVGAIAAQNLLKTNTAIGMLRGKVHKYGVNNVPLVATYHPAYLLRSPAQKAQAWKDLQGVVGILRHGNLL